MLRTLIVLLAAAAIAVPLSRRAGLGSVLGYLVAGVVIGPHGLGLVSNVDQIAEVAELGIVMLLFLIGLELRPSRLWVMRRAVFGLGPAQVVACAAALAALVRAAGLEPWPGAIAVGAGLALSSTAIVLPMLAERDLLGQRSGRDAFAVLLFQDLAFIPLVALLPLLGEGAAQVALPWRAVLIDLATVAAILGVGRYALPYLFRLIGGARVPELFNTVALLIVAGTAGAASAAGLSPSFGAFLAGVVLSGSEYRHELAADIEPFEGLLLGFFFISVGMSADLGLLGSLPLELGCAALALLAVKMLLNLLLARSFGRPSRPSIRFALALAQGSEFSFVLFGAAVGLGVLSPRVADAATLVVALSMAATPVLFALSERFLTPRFERREEPAYDAIEGDAPVIIAGFGRVGQIVGRVLRTQGIAFTALETDSGQVEVIRRFGAKVFYGNPARPDVLRAAGAEHARLLVVAVDSMEEGLRVVQVARNAFPELRIIARAHNRRHAHLLMDVGALDAIVRDTFYSSLRMAAESLRVLGTPPDQADRAVEIFRESDERLLRETHAIYQDEQKLIQTTQDAAAELRALFEADRPEPETES
jgi:CPA2 family monovalent cation:H+ antiporter-2/glutathione-regulated potassium-efflux system protein KefB